MTDPVCTYLQGLGFPEVQAHEAGYQVTLPPDLSPAIWAMAWHATAGKLRLVCQGVSQATAKEAHTSEIEGLADRILHQALALRSSDLHFEPSDSQLHVRYRLDGHLAKQNPVPATKKDALTAHLKIRAGMDIAERRRPQDGRLTFIYEGRAVDMRVSTLPTQYGEKMVLRVLDKVDVQLNLEALGMPAAQRALLQQAIAKPYGFVLVTGPTGSGKTTTLYACLEHIKNDSLNIMTIEDPIEYRLDGINQTQVKPEIGVDFAAALRTFLRQDPNVIMVGEIRDKETAELAMRASLTGHLVLSTLHANDACAAIPRLLDMGLPPALLSGSLSLIMAQRLLRRCCRVCSQPSRATSPELPAETGCLACAGTGFSGRLGVFEVVPINEAFHQAIQAKTAVGGLRELARQQGFPSLEAAARERVALGETTETEMLREVIV